MARTAAQLPDWIFSAPIKRRVIAYVVSPQNHGKMISERDLAGALGVDPRGSIDEHLFALTQLGLLQRHEGPRRFRILPRTDMTETSRDLSDALRDLVGALERVKAVSVDKPK